MIASLPMYAAPRAAAANTALWQRIRDNLRARGLEAPDQLTHGGDLWSHWRAPDLVLSQTCGLPFRAQLADQVTLIGTPDYGVRGCAPGHYFSVVVARSDDTRDSLADFRFATFAFNDPLSQSGWAALAMDAPQVLSGPMVQTGSHRASVYAVREGRADFAAVDAVTLRHLRAASEATGLKTVHQTPPTPGLPFITRAGQDAGPYFDAIAAAIDALPRLDAEVLGIIGLAAIPAADYLAIPVPPAPPLRERANCRHMS